MKLSKVSLRRYRSIEELDEFSVQADVTCLVGKNESGKTAVLQALLKSNPIDNSKFDESLDYPSSLTSEQRRAKGAIQVSRLTYELDDDDVEAVDAELGVGALVSREAVVETGYRYKGGTWSIEVDELKIVEHLRQGLDLPSGPQAAVKSATSIESLTETLDGLDDPNAGAQAVLAKVAAWRRSDPSLAAIDLLNKRRPRFVYFGEYDAIPGLVNIPELITLRQAGSLTRSQQAFLSLLDFANVDLDDFVSPASHEHLVRSIENASNGITSEVFTYWSQNRNLRVQLSNFTDAAGDPGVQIRVLNEKHHVTVPFDERSHGFVWFFSFLAYFSGLEETSEQPIILLLDEPGLSLHAKAQADLMRFIEERLAPQHQVIYTTHSPFMIDSQHLERVRTVQDEDPGGTKVSGNVLHADSDTVFPLMAALGMDLTQTLWVGPNVLLVEGPSDLVYLTYVSRRLEEVGRTGLDPRWVITPAGGITKLPSFLSIFGSNKMNVAVLTDSSTVDAPTIAKLKQIGKLGYGGIVRVGEALARDEADIEDLLPIEFYLALARTAYAGALAGRSLSESDLPSGDRIVKRIETYFAENAINNGQFNHFAPAGVVLRGAIPAGVEIGEAELSAAEAIFNRINGMLADLDS